MKAALLIKKKKNPVAILWESVWFARVHVAFHDAISSVANLVRVLINPRLLLFLRCDDLGRAVFCRVATYGVIIVSYADVVELILIVAQMSEDVAV